MRTNKHMKDLETSCERWKERVASIKARIDALISWGEEGYSNREGSSLTECDRNVDQIPLLIEAEQNTLNMYEKILAVRESQRDRAISR